MWGFLLLGDALSKQRSDLKNSTSSVGAFLLSAGSCFPERREWSHQDFLSVGLVIIWREIWHSPTPPRRVFSRPSHQRGVTQDQKNLPSMQIALPYFVYYYPPHRNGSPKSPSKAKVSSYCLLALHDSIAVLWIFKAARMAAKFTDRNEVNRVRRWHVTQNGENVQVYDPAWPADSQMTAVHQVSLWCCHKVTLQRYL